MSAVVEKEWTAAAADAGSQAKAAALRTRADLLAARARQRDQAAAPVRTLVTFAGQVVTDVDAAVTALLKAPEGGESPQFPAARRERLQGGIADGTFTHVLYVSLDALGADSVTRRSILGSSGVVRFMSAGNASWLLLGTEKGIVVGGRQKNVADIMTLGLETGKAQFAKELKLTTSSDNITDPLIGLEKWAKGLVAVLAVALLIVGALSIVAVVRIALG